MQYRMIREIPHDEGFLIKILWERESLDGYKGPLYYMSYMMRELVQRFEDGEWVRVRSL